MEGDDSLRWVMSSASGSAKFILEDEKTHKFRVVPQFESWPPQETARPKDGRPLPSRAFRDGEGTAP
jgi:hypothetical protein